MLFYLFSFGLIHRKNTIVSFVFSFFYYNTFFAFLLLCGIAINFYEGLKRFKIPIVPPTTNKCIRFPNNVIEQVEESIKGERLHLFGFCGRSSPGSTL